MTDVRLDVDGCATVLKVFDETARALHLARSHLDAEPIQATTGWWPIRHQLSRLLADHQLDARRLAALRRAALMADGASWPRDPVRRGWNSTVSVVLPSLVRHTWASVAVGTALLEGAGWSLRLRDRLGDDEGSADAVAAHADAADPGGTFDLRSIAAFPGAEAGSPLARGRAATSRLLADTSGLGRVPDSPPLAAADEFQLIDHGQGAYSVVLGGVIDLSTPAAGLDPDHQSSRDLDVNAADSAFTTSPGDDAYARLVAEGVRRAGVPPGSRLLLIGHSYGALAAVHLAADPVFNGDDYNVTHVVASGYHVEPWLGMAAPPTEVLVLQNRWDLVVRAESVADWAVIDGPSPPHHAIVATFDGGFSGAGHSQAHYVDYIEGTRDLRIARFLATVAHGGFAGPGPATAIDISMP